MVAIQLTAKKVLKKLVVLGHNNFKSIVLGYG